MNFYRNIVMFGNSRWREDMNGNSSQQLALAFLQLGHRVMYITPNKTQPVSLADFSESFVNLSLSKELIKRVGKILKDWSATPLNTILICSLATKHSRELMEYFASGGYKIVYRNVDWFDTSNPEFQFDHQALSFAAEISCLIMVSHPELKKQFPERDRNVITLTNGVDFDLFHESQPEIKPADLVKGTITIGFWGTFWGNRIDWPLIVFLASRNSDWHFNLIADLQYIDVDRQALPANVHFLGLKRQTALPCYIQNFDLCLIPYRTDLPFARYSNPIKTLESLAASKPVVAPLNASLQNYPGLFFYGSPKEAEEKISEAVQTELNHELMVHFARANTWQEKAKAILCQLNSV